jgi:hypothetical protein
MKTQVLIGAGLWGMGAEERGRGLAVSRMIKSPLPCRSEESANLNGGGQGISELTDFQGEIPPLPPSLRSGSGSE